MILDASLLFSNAQALANAAGAYDSANIIDLGVPGGLPSSAAGGGARDLGIGDNPAMKILVQIVQAAVGAGASLQALLQGAPDNGAGAPGTWYTLGGSSITPVASLTAGARLFAHDMHSLPSGVPVPRFLKMVYNISGAALTGGAVSAGLVLDRYDQIRNAPGVDSAYPPGIAIAN